MKMHLRRVSRASYLLLGCLWLLPNAVRAADTLAAGVGVGAVIDAGVLATWGKNDSGQLGHSAGTTPVSTPALVPGSWQKLALGTAFTLAQDNTGLLFAWGSNSAGQLGTGSVATSSASPLRVAALGLGVSVSDFVAGDSHALALGSDGKVYSWGNNGLGQLGTGDTVARTAPVRLAITRTTGKGARAVTTAMSFRAIAATDNSSLAIATDGTLWAWGSNSSGELGTASKRFANPVPTQVGKAGGWTALFTGARHVIGIQNGKPYVWGDNSMAQLGTGSTGRPVTKPTALKLKPSKGQKLPAFTTYAAGDYQSFAFAADGRLYAWGNNLMGQLGVVPALSGGNIARSPVLVSATERYSKVSSGAFFTLLRTTALSPTPSALFSVGSNVNGELGIGTTLNDRGSGLTVAPVVGVANLSVAAPALVSETLTDGVPTYGTGTSIGELSLVVQNRGTGSYTDDYTVAYYLSKDSTLDAGDRLLASHLETGVTLVPDSARGTTFTSAELRIPNIISGSYFLLSQVNPAAGDSFSPDNGAATPLLIQGPDLQVTGSAGKGSGLILPSVIATVRNLGLGVIPAGREIPYEVYLSIDSKLTPVQGGDILLKSGSHTVGVDGFGPGASAEVAIGSVDIPVNTTGGSYFALVVFNRQGAIAESDLSNNVAAIPVSLPSSDLTVSAITLPFEALGSSTSVTLTATVSNEGSMQFTGNYLVKFYLSDDAVYDFLDAELGTWNSPSAGLAPGDKILASLTAFLPKNSIGTRHLIARVSSADGVSDRVPSNNISSVETVINPPKIEIDKDTVKGLNDSVDVGGNLGPLTIELTNTGAGAIAAGRPVSVTFYISKDGTLAGNPFKLETLSYTGGLTAGGSASLTTATALPTTNIPNGVYSLVIEANGDKSISEANTVLVALPVSIGSVDVEVTAPTLGQLELGTNTTVASITLSVSNIEGFEVPEGATIDLLLSSDSVASAQDIALQTRKTLNEVLPLGRSIRVNFIDVLIPDRVPGDYFLIARVNLPNSLNDKNSTNNTAATRVTLARPHLTIESVTAPATVDLDATLTVAIEDLKVINDARGVIPLTTPLSLAVYLVTDNEVEVDSESLLNLNLDSFSPLATTPTIAPLAGLGALDDFTFPDFTLALPSDTPGGNANLIFVVTVADSTTVTNAKQRVLKALPVYLKKATNPGPALDYGVVEFNVPGNTGDKQWLSIDDNRASGASAFRSPGLSTSGAVSMSYSLIGPAELRAPWKIQSTNPSDQLSYTIKDESLVEAGEAQLLSSDSFANTYNLPGGIPISIPAGFHTVTWTYTQASSDPLNQARVDLDVPVYTTSGAGGWFSEGTPLTPKIGASYARSPVALPLGQQSSLGVDVTGPALVRFWWRTSGTADKDILSFSVNDQPAQFPTDQLTADATSAQISGTSADWTLVAFLIPAGPQRISWNYTQGSSDATAFGAVDALQVITPIPLSSDPSEYQPSSITKSAFVPDSNVDLAITAAGTVAQSYLLDDAAGTSRLPLTVEVASIGSGLVESGVSVVFKNESFVNEDHTGARAEAIVSGGVITDLFLLTGGSGYSPGAVPTVTISPPNPGASGARETATATAVMATGAISDALLADGGTGYNAVPTVSVTAPVGSGAVLEARLGVRSIALAAPFAFADAPQVLIVGGGGTGAEASPIYENGFVTGLTVTDTGTGYTTVPNVTFNGDTPPVTVTAELAVVKLAIKDGGSGYNSTVGLTLAGGAGTDAEVTAQSLGGPITSTVVKAGGQGYTSAPTVSVTGSGTGAAVATRLGLNAITVNTAGVGYTSAPGVSLTHPGAGATATAVVNSAGVVTTLTPGAGGSGYIAEPAVVFTGGGGRGAAAKARISGGIVTGLTLTSGGAGYTSAPSVEIKPYEQAQAKAYLTLNSFEVIGSGAGYDVTRDQVADPFVTVSPPADFVAPTLIVTVADGVVTAVTVDDPGSGAYHLGETDITITAPLAAPSAPANLDCTAKGKVIQGKLVGVTITDGGSGFTNGTTVVTLQPKSPTITVTLTPDPVRGYVFTGVTIIPSGIAFASPPIVTVEAPDATATIKVTAALKPVLRVAGLEVTAPGFGYSEAPLISVGAPTTGTRAEITAVLDEGKVVSYTILNGGSGYNAAPLVTVAPPPELATAIATVSSSGTVNAVLVTNSGSGYETMPAVVFTGGGASTAATGTATGRVVSAEVVSGGTGYSPAIAFTGGAPVAAAEASVTVEAGTAVRRLDVVSGGSGYTSDAINTGGLEVRLSRNGIYGDGDDVVLGNYALLSRSLVPNGRGVLFDMKLNLPLDLASGDYNVMVAYIGFGSEFTMANNYRMLTGVNIKRAPNLVLKAGGSYLSPAYPYHPEDAFYLDYTIQNTGLGTVTTDQPFKVGLKLLALKPNESGVTDLAAGILIHTYAEKEIKAYMPEAGGVYPAGGEAPVYSFLDLPSQRDILVALGLVPPGALEDSAAVQVAREKLAEFDFYFQLSLDVGNRVAESSEINEVFVSTFFKIMPIRLTENFAQYMGQSAFAGYFQGKPGVLPGVTFDTTFRDPQHLESGASANRQFTGYVWKYALYGDPGEVDSKVGNVDSSTNEFVASGGQPNLLFQSGLSSDTVDLGGIRYQTISFDFNVRANDVEIDVYAVNSAGGDLPGDVVHPNPLFTLSPPYNQMTGAKSITGNGGLKDHPLVLSVEGNVTDVQQVYAARITLRDNQPQSARTSTDRLEVRVRALTAALPVAPTSVGVGNAVLGITLKINGGSRGNGAFVIERTIAGLDDYSIIGSTMTTTYTDEKVVDQLVYKYRVYAASSAGITAAIESLLIERRTL
jgi:alpha-tubulin suppressor-like RCC1 family protein